ncbi:unnamed protein product [Arctogadus glacialis]
MTHGQGPQTPGVKKRSVSYPGRCRWRQQSHIVPFPYAHWGQAVSTAAQQTDHLSSSTSVPPPQLLCPAPPPHLLYLSLLLYLFFSTSAPSF